LDAFRTVHGLIFLFKWVKDDEPAGSVVQGLDNVFFAKQVIQNACATQAILSVLLNVNHPDMSLGETLGDFKEFTQSFDAYNKGLAMSNAQQIRSVHNSFARQTLFEMDNSKNKPDEDVFHFISYLPVHGRLYELDGLKEGPVDLGAIGDKNWLDVVRPVIEKRIQKYSEGEIHFNLMAVVSDRQMLCQRQLDELLNASADAMETDTKQSEIAKLRMQIDDEIMKRKRYKVCHCFDRSSGRRAHFVAHFRSRTSAASTTISRSSLSFCESSAKRVNCRLSTKRPSSEPSNVKPPSRRSNLIKRAFSFLSSLTQVSRKTTFYHNQVNISHWQGN
jgi:Ubiquitin carboxyl-terminal hydrolase, family 1